MKRILLSIILMLSLSAVLAGCANRLDRQTGVLVDMNDGGRQETGERAETPDKEMTTALPSIDAQNEQTTESAESRYKPTEAVTYSAEGIPVSNAYFSLWLPSDWDGHFLCETNYSADVMLLRFRNRECADAGTEGTLFTLALVPDGALFDAAEITKLRMLSDDTDTYALYAVYPTETQYSEETEARYVLMQEEIDAIWDTLEPGDGFHF